MIEVKAHLPGRSVFLAGETIECNVTFTNVPKIRRNGSPVKQKAAKLAWASAQIHCQCSVSEARVELPHSNILTQQSLSSPSNDTSFVPFKGERGAPVLSTKPIILFCDLTLQPGESRSISFEKTIPVEAPPSFRGASVKYSYKLTIGTQRFDCPTKLLRVPLRVLLIPGLNDVSVYEEEQGHSTKPSNPFQKLQMSSHSLLDVAMEVLQTITCRKTNNSYNITNSHGKVARFGLFKQAFRIGDDIVGTFDFSQSTIPCVQFSVTLQSEEQIADECRKKGSSNSGNTVTSYSKHHEFCLHTSKTHISIPIPLTATPGFITDIVCLRWRLHFEFVTCKIPLADVPQPEGPENSATWQGPRELDVETMVWDLPIRVFATNPIHATTVSLLKLENKLHV